MVQEPGAVQELGMVQEPGVKQGSGRVKQESGN